MAEVVIVGGARTAFGRFGGVWKDKTAAELGGIAIGGALFKSDVNPAEVDAVIMGMALRLEGSKSCASSGETGRTWLAGASGDGK